MGHYEGDMFDHLCGRVVGGGHDSGTEEQPARGANSGNCRDGLRGAIRSNQRRASHRLPRLHSGDLQSHERRFKGVLLHVVEDLQQSIGLLRLRHVHQQLPTQVNNARPPSFAPLARASFLTTRQQAPTRARAVLTLTFIHAASLHWNQAQDVAELVATSSTHPSTTCLFHRPPTLSFSTLEHFPKLGWPRGHRTVPSRRPP